MEGKKNGLIYPELSYKTNGILFDVHNSLGGFCREKQYCDAIEKGLIRNNISYKREAIIKNDNELLNNNSNRADFVIEDKIVIEVKTKRFVDRQDYHQLKRYLIASGKKLGLLVNFHQKYLRPKRVINSKAKEDK